MIFAFRGFSTTPPRHLLPLVEFCLEFILENGILKGIENCFHWTLVRLLFKFSRLCNDFPWFGSACSDFSGSAAFFSGSSSFIVVFWGLGCQFFYSAASFRNSVATFPVLRWIFQAQRLRFLSRLSLNQLLGGDFACLFVGSWVIVVNRERLLNLYTFSTAVNFCGIVTTFRNTSATISGSTVSFPVMSFPCSTATFLSFYFFGEDIFWIELSFSRWINHYMSVSIFRRNL